MLDLLKQALSSPFGSFAFVFAIMVLVGWAIYYVTRFTTKITSEHGIFQKTVEKMEQNLDKIKEDIIILKSSVNNLTKGDRLTQSCSPIALSESGIQVAKTINIEEKVSRNWSKIQAYIDANVADKNAYDIQQFCIEKATVDLSNFFPLSDINDIKNHAFKEGRMLESYGGLIGVVIRDAYFRIKDIDLSEVDKCDPVKKFLPT